MHRKGVVEMNRGRGRRSVFLFCWHEHIHDVHSDQTERPPLSLRVVRPYYFLKSSWTSGVLKMQFWFPFPKTFHTLLQESHKRAKQERTEPLDGHQLFVVDLARDMSRVCQVKPPDCARHLLLGVICVHQSYDPLCFPEVCCPRAHLEPGGHLANPSVQGLHPAVVLHAYEQGAGISRSRICYMPTHLLKSFMLLPAEEADADRWLARDGWGQTAWWERVTWPAASQGCDPHLGEGPESSARGGKFPETQHVCCLLTMSVNTLIVLQQSVWPGEPVAKVLEDLQSAWRWGRVPNLVTAMELVMWTLMLQRPDKVGVRVTIHRDSV